jgi:hypothetical protein
VDLVVEARPDDDIEAWRDVFGQVEASGVSPWATENKYELEGYVRWRPTPLRRLETTPARQQDLLLTRRETPA